MSEYIYPNDTPVTLLDCENAFSELSEKEMLYTHYLSRASWFGGLIDLLQTSLESPLIFILLHKLFKLESVNELKERAINKCGLNEEDFKAFLVYTSGILNNIGNYKGFGDTKFVPNLKKEKFEKIILSSKFGQKHPQEVEKLLSRCLNAIYSLSDKECHLGFPHNATTTYFSKNITEDDIKATNLFLKNRNIEAWNTRLFKTIDEGGKNNYEVRLASVLETDDAEDKYLICTDNANGHSFTTTRGDYSKLLKLVNQNLLLAKEHAANENEETMISKYIHSFRTGSINAHKDGSRFWIRDKGPIVESYIGFIETYRDPVGMRGEFRGFVAVVNKKMSAKFSNLVNYAEKLLPLLPWPKAFEKDVFLRPDFTSLDVVTFANSRVPAGINIPNYQEVKQSDGFKNVSLGNTMSEAKEPPNFVNKADQDLLLHYGNLAFEFHVGLHELLGHGSGKFFKRNKDGSFNFDAEVINFETNKKVSSWYNEGETYTSLFGSIGSSYEECRAECVALYLCDQPEALRIFGYEGSKAEDIVYSCWLSMILMGIQSLQMYDTKSKSWLQAHSQARYVILRVLLDQKQDFIKIEKLQDSSGNSDLLISLDRSKISSQGKPCIGSFLKKLQLFRSIADVESAKEMYDKYSTVASEAEYPFLEYREVVMARRKPRRMFVQANTFLEGNKVILKNYESTPEGMIQSWIERFQDINVDDILEELWRKDQHHFS